MDAHHQIRTTGNTLATIRWRLFCWGNSSCSLWILVGANSPYALGGLIWECLGDCADLTAILTPCDYRKDSDLSITTVCNNDHPQSIGRSAFYLLLRDGRLTQPVCFGYRTQILAHERRWSYQLDRIDRDRAAGSRYWHQLIAQYADSVVRKLRCNRLDHQYRSHTANKFHVSRFCQRINALTGLIGRLKQSVSHIQSRDGGLHRVSTTETRPNLWL